MAEKLYNFTLKSGGVPNLISIETFSKHLKENGFSNIKVIDIFKNVRYGLKREMIIGIPFFFACIIKKILKPKKYNHLKDTDFLLGISSLSAILSLKKTSRYYAVYANKDNR